MPSLYASMINNCGRRYLGRERLRMGDVDSAIQLYKRASDAGDCMAQFELAEMCVRFLMPIPMSSFFCFVQIYCQRRFMQSCRHARSGALVQVLWISILVPVVGMRACIIKLGTSRTRN